VLDPLLKTEIQDIASIVTDMSIYSKSDLMASEKKNQ